MRRHHHFDFRPPWLGMLALAIACIAWTPASARASIWLGSGSGTDGSVAGEATINLSTNTITLVLTNLLSATDFRSAGQALSDVTFTLSGNVSFTGATVMASGTGVNIDDNGNVTSAPGMTSRWQISGSNGNFLLTTLSGKQPSYMIAPSGSSYPDVNKGVNNFIPYFQGTATITIANVSGLTPDTTVNGVGLSFGTSLGETEIATTAVPAPPSALIAMSGLGVMGLAGLAVSCYRRRAALAYGYVPVRDSAVF